MAFLEPPRCKPFGMNPGCTLAFGRFGNSAFAHIWAVDGAGQWNSSIPAAIISVSKCFVGNNIIIGEACGGRHRIQVWRGGGGEGGYGSLDSRLGRLWRACFVNRRGVDTLICVREFGPAMVEVDTRTGHYLQDIPLDKKLAAALHCYVPHAYCPNSDAVALSSVEQPALRTALVAIVAYTSGELLRRIKVGFDNSAIQSVAFTSGGSHIAVADAEFRCVWKYAVADGNVVVKVAMPGHFMPRLVLGLEAGGIAVACSRQYRLLSAASRSRSAIVYLNEKCEVHAVKDMSISCTDFPCGLYRLLDGDDADDLRVQLEDHTFEVIRALWGHGSLSRRAFVRACIFGE